MMRAVSVPSEEFRVFGISLHSVPVNRPLPIDVYVEVAGKLTLIRRVGDTFSAERIRGLHRHNVQQVYAPVEQRPAYKEYLWSLVVACAPDDPTRLLSINEGAHIQLEELHQATELAPAVEGTVDFLKRFCSLSAKDASIL